MVQQFGIGLEQHQGSTGFRVFRHCCAQARQCKHRFSGQPLLPSGARIFYYTRRLLLAQGARPEVNPDEDPLTEQATEIFLQTAPLVAEWLVTEFSRAVQLRAEPRAVLQCFLSRKPASEDSELIGTPEFPNSSNEWAQQVWEQNLATYRREAAQGYLPRLLVLTRPDRLPVAPVAGPDDTERVALRLLRAQLAQDTRQGRDMPPVGAYLYNEPLETWLLRSLMLDHCPARHCEESRCAYRNRKAVMADARA